jgi:hypothetical protein
MCFSKDTMNACCLPPSGPAHNKVPRHPNLQGLSMMYSSSGQGTMVVCNAMTFEPTCLQQIKESRTCVCEPLSRLSWSWTRLRKEIEMHSILDQVASTIQQASCTVVSQPKINSMCISSRNNQICYQHLMYLLSNCTSGATPAKPHCEMLSVHSMLPAFPIEVDHLHLQ